LKATHNELLPHTFKSPYTDLLYTTQFSLQILGTNTIKYLTGEQLTTFVNFNHTHMAYHSSA